LGEINNIEKTRDLEKNSNIIQIENLIAKEIFEKIMKMYELNLKMFDTLNEKYVFI